MKIPTLLLILSISLSVSAQITAVQFGPNLPPGIQASILRLLNHTSQFPVQQFSASATIPSLQAGSFLLSFGLTTTSQQVLDYSKLKGSETLMVYSDIQNDTTRVISDGNPLSTSSKTSIGAGFAAYRALELLGFAFLHPFEPTIPPKLLKPSVTLPYLQTETPHWPFRGTHYHTEHPLELTEFLQGMGMNRSVDAKDPSWESMLPELDLFAQWLVATRQNRIEWILLCGKSWEKFCETSLRVERLKKIVSVLHSYGVLAGADLPIAMKQQNAWYMIQNFGDMKKELKQIETRIDWLLAVGFDFLSTETGFSEFTHPDDEKMLTWMNHAADYTQKKGSDMYIKVHCSTGQYCKDYKDPRDGSPLNFNFLPMLANSSMGVFAHTVQMYTFDDPAPTYGNQNFTYMYDYMMYEASRRPTIYYGETAYWVNYDIDVPLLLPVYGSSRLYDLRKAAAAEAKHGRIQGQMNFCSGFEWGYWLNEIMTHRAAWKPYVEAGSDAAALQSLLIDILPVFGSATGKLVEVIKEIIAAEQQLLILGQVTGKPKPKDVTKRNGIAYLEGWDTWADISALLGKMQTQPDRIGLLAVRNPFHNSSYQEVAPLLAEMADRFTSLTDKLEGLRKIVPEYTLSLLDDLKDAMSMTALRAVQINALYKYASLSIIKKDKKLLAVSVDAIHKAEQIVTGREKNYRVPVDRIASWRVNPTVYNFGYLWTVHSLFYMRRDHEKATSDNVEVLSPCYKNYINPLITAFGEGIIAKSAQLIHELLEKMPELDMLNDCLAPPKEEPHFDPPRDKQKSIFHFINI